MKKIVLVNQTANYLFADIIKAYASRLPDMEIEAWYGSFDYDVSRLPTNVSLKQGPKYNRESFSKRVTSWLRFYFWMKGQLRAIDVKNTSFFFVSNPPLFVWLPKIKQLNFDCLIYDLYPNVLGDMRKKSMINAVAKRWEKKNREVFPKAQHIYTIGEGLKEAIVAYIPSGTDKKVTILPVWNVSSTTSVSTRGFKVEWGLEGRKVVLYSGNIGLTHPLEYMVDLAKRMQEHKDWVFVIVGNGAKKTQLEQQANGLDNILFKKPVPFEDLSALLRIADWGYVTLDSSATNTSVPSKTYNLLAAGVPILAMVNQQSDIAKLIDNYKVGIHFKEEDIDDTVQQIVTMSDSDLSRLKGNAVECSTHFTSALADTFANNWVTTNV